MTDRRRRRPPVRRFLTLALPLAAALAVSACAAPRIVHVENADTTDSADNLEILAPLPEFTPRRLPAGWVIAGALEAAREGLAVVEEGGVPALKVVSGKRGFVLARRTRAVLLATPYLSWAWNVESHGAGLHPINLVIGFQGGARENVSRGSQSLTWLGKALPPHDRILAMAWGDSALNRGNLTPASADEPGMRRYVARGGARACGLLVAGNGGPFPNLFPGMARRRYRGDPGDVHRLGGGRRPVPRRRPHLGRQAFALESIWILWPPIVERTDAPCPACS